MPPFRLRRATPADAPDIAYVQIASWQSTYSGLVPQGYLDGLPLGRERRAERWRGQLETQTVLVAQDENGVFGFVGGGPAQSGIPGFGGELYAIYLLRAAQGRGAGRALVGALARELQAGGFKDLALWVLKDNPSRGFYERLGGQYVTERDIEIGGAALREVALGWPDVGILANPGP